jgi:hypothetical protein
MRRIEQDEPKAHYRRRLPALAEVAAKFYQGNLSHRAGFERAAGLDHGLEQVALAHPASDWRADAFGWSRKKFNVRVCDAGEVSNAINQGALIKGRGNPQRAEFDNSNVRICAPRFISRARLEKSPETVTRTNLGESRTPSGALPEEWTHVFNSWKQTARAPETGRSHARWPGPKSASGWPGYSRAGGRTTVCFSSPRNVERRPMRRLQAITH